MQSRVCRTLLTSTSVSSLKVHTTLQDFHSVHGLHTFGAWIAHAIAAVLEKVDTKVEVLIMLDPPCLQTLQHPNSSMLAVMIANGPQLMRKCIDGCDYERIHQYERNSIHQTQLLAVRSVQKSCAEQ